MADKVSPRPRSTSYSNLLDALDTPLFGEYNDWQAYKAAKAAALATGKSEAKTDANATGGEDSGTATVAEADINNAADSNMHPPPPPPAASSGQHVSRRSNTRKVAQNSLTYNRSKSILAPLLRRSQSTSSSTSSVEAPPKKKVGVNFKDSKKSVKFTTGNETTNAPGGEGNSATTYHPTPPAASGSGIESSNSKPSSEDGDVDSTYSQSSAEMETQPDDSSEMSKNLNGAAATPNIHTSGITQGATNTPAVEEAMDTSINCLGELDLTNRLNKRSAAIQPPTLYDSDRDSTTSSTTSTVVPRTEMKEASSANLQHLSKIPKQTPPPAAGCQRGHYGSIRLFD
jgi:hypothetical protein